MFGRPLGNQSFFCRKSVGVQGIVLHSLRAFFDFLKNNKKKSIKLEICHVFTLGSYNELIHESFNIILRMVDSEDMLLNIFRERLQQNKTQKHCEKMKVICRNIVKKCRELSSELAEYKENYKKFCDVLSKNLKL